MSGLFIGSGSVTWKWGKSLQEAAYGYGYSQTTGGAMRVRFASVELNEIPAASRDYGDGGFRFELLSC